jgi:hypothetical protein
MISSLRNGITATKAKEHGDERKRSSQIDATPRDGRGAAARLMAIAGAGALVLGACGGGGTGAGTASVAATPSTSVAVSAATASNMPATQEIDLCSGIAINNNDRTPVPYSPLAKPAKGQAVIDPDFGTTIRRITDVAADWGTQTAVPVYPTIQPWNADESLMFVYVTSGGTTALKNGPGGTFGWALLDGKTYAFKEWLPVNPADVEQLYWDTKNPDLIYYVDNYATPAQHAVLTRLHVSTGVKDQLHDFIQDTGPNGVLSMCNGTTHISAGGDPYFMSYDNDLIGLGCAFYAANQPTNYLPFSYRISTNTIVPYNIQSGVVPQPTPSGRAMYMEGGTASAELNIATGATLQSVAFNGFEHADLLRSANGDDLIAGVQYDDPSGSGTLMWADLTTGGAVHTLIGPATGLDPYPPSGTLVSGTAYKNPGWVAIGITGDIYSYPKTYLDQEVLLANLDTGKFCRVAHHRSTGDYNNAPISNYWAQPNVSLSPSGTRILVQSDWGNASPGNLSCPANSTCPNPDIVDTYVIELPTYHP